MSCWTWKVCCTLRVQIAARWLRCCSLLIWMVFIYFILYCDFTEPACVSNRLCSTVESPEANVMCSYCSLSFTNPCFIMMKEQSTLEIRSVSNNTIMLEKNVQLESSPCESEGYLYIKGNHTWLLDYLNVMFKICEVCYGPFALASGYNLLVSGNITPVSRILCRSYVHCGCWFNLYV